MKNWLKDFLTFSNREHKGSISLLFLLAFFILLPNVIVHVPSVEQPTEKDLLEDAFAHYSDDAEKPKTASLFKFNPNTVSKEDLLLLGLSEKTANLLIKYRSKGGAFKTAADFKKIYTLPQSTYARLEPFLTFGSEETKQTITTIVDSYDTVHYQKFPFDPNTISPDSLKMLGLMKNEINHLLNLRKMGVIFYKKEQFKVSSWRPNKILELQPFVRLPVNIAPTPATKPSTDLLRQTASKMTKELCDLNTATQEQLMRVNGIGNYYAKTILEKRGLLGSFLQISQLADFMPDTLYKKILPQVTLGAKPVKKIKINAIDLPSLQQFPGLKYKAALIINYRNHHGHFASILDLWKVEGIRKDLLDKLAPYLDFEK